MTFFGPHEVSSSLADTALDCRKVVALSLIKRFAEVFDEIEYELLWDVPIINAQASRLRESRRVTVYGGLARHPSITASGLALILAHETGHHLGGRPLDPDLRWPTWQGQADFWAAAQGMPKVFGWKACKMTLRGAKQIADLHAEFCAEGDEPDISAAERTAIFRAGALGEAAPTVLQAAFHRLLDGRKDTN
ncbi:hypothetical protein I6F35_26410 [Bradyrhizobium sp. BRP22]|uniref:hypothetical protein n=1 Tax=Bradyrhizobium sp. BRP22 TaxID=2793821 RepID=UPI001CD725EE|nr:hypothetical protein [Bradyrhizobium sp. BRP22]MCA1456707.1 hypothetical protein [Bradyrhizobium sp. BRP22]